MVMDDDVLQSSSAALSRRRADLRLLLLQHLGDEASGIIHLFDLWGAIESDVSIPKKEMVIGHVLRELLQDLYKSEEVIKDKIGEVYVDCEFDAPEIPADLAHQFEIDPVTRKLTWRGDLPNTTLHQIQNLSESQAYKWCCYQLAVQVERGSIKEELSQKLGQKLAREDPLKLWPAVHEGFLERYNRLRDYFTDASHGGRVKKDQWNNNISHVEAMLLALVSGQGEISSHIVKQIENPTPTKDDLARLAPFILRNSASYWFFFEKVGPQWFHVLRDEKWLEELPEPIRKGQSIQRPSWNGAHVLRKAAAIMPKEVEEVIFKLRVQETMSGSVISDILHVLLELAGKTKLERVLRRCLNERWLEQDFGGFTDHRCVELFVALLRHGDDSSASILLEAMLGFKVKGEDEAERAKPFTNEHYVSEALRNLSALPPQRLPKLLGAVARSLAAMCLYRAVQEDDERSLEESLKLRLKGSELYRFQTEYKDVLEEELIRYYTSAEILLSEEDVLKELSRILKSLEPVKEHKLVYASVVFGAASRFPTAAYQLVVNSLDDFDLTSLTSIALDYLPSVLESISDEERRTVLDRIAQGPTDHEDEKYVVYWKARRLKPILPLLTSTERNQFAELLRTAEALPAEEATSTWIGPTSPLSLSELQKLSPEDLLEYFEQWQPASEFFGDSVAGLGRALSELVALNPERFTKVSAEFLNRKLNPTYLYYLLSGYRSAAKERRSFSWEPVINFVGEIVEKNRDRTIYEHTPAEVLEVSWSGVTQAVCELLEAGFSRDDLKVNAETTTAILGDLIYLATASDPSPDEEAFQIAKGTDPLHLSLNSTRGWAMRAILSLLQSSKRHGLPNAAELISEGLSCLINSAKLSHFASRIVGESLPWMMNLDGAKSFDILKQVLANPIDSLAYSAWEGYVGNRLWKSDHLLVSAHLEVVFSRLKEFKPPWKDRKNPLQEIGYHLVNAYLYSIGSNAEADLKRYLAVVDAEERAGLVWFVGSQYLQTKNGFGDGEGEKRLIDVDLSILISYWRTRLEESSDPKELCNFGWWIDVGILDSKEMLSLLLSTLEKTNGRIEPLYKVRLVLQQLVEELPVAVLKCLLKILRNKDSSLLSGHFGSGGLKKLLSITKAMEDTEVRYLRTLVRDALLKLGLHQYSED
jgi:hypothetical protein